MASQTRSLSRAETQGWVFNVQRFCVEDGPGIRTSVFLKGCPMRCLWCHNPESQLPGPQFSFDRERCLKCGSCFAACPQHGIDRFSPFPNPKVCTLCEQCVDACPNGSRQIIGQRTSVADLVESVVRDLGFFEESGGGVTFTGGEPLMQPDFLIECLTALRKRGAHTALDTCGYAKSEDLLQAAGLSDLVLYDVKHVNDKRHRKLTGVSNRVVLENLRLLAAESTAVWIRVPLIPGQNDDEQSLRALGEVLSDLPKRYPVWLLPYHWLGIQKRERLGMPEPLRFEPPTPAHVEECAELLRGFRLEVLTRKTQ